MGRSRSAVWEMWLTNPFAKGNQIMLKRPFHGMHYLRTTKGRDLVNDILTEYIYLINWQALVKGKFEEWIMNYEN